MKYLLTGVAAIALLTACGDKNKDKDGASPAGIELSDGKLQGVKLRKGDPATAGAVLSAFSLDKSGSGRVSFTGSDVNGAKAVFKNVTLVSAEEMDAEEADDDGELHLKGSDLKAGEMTFEGLGMLNGKPNFSKIVLSDVSFVPKDPAENQGSSKIKSMELVNPSPETAAWIASLFGKGEAMDMPEGKALAFDLWSMKDVNFKIDEEEGQKGDFLISTVEVLGLKDEKAAQMAMKGLTLNMIDPTDNTDLKASLGDVDIRGVNLAVLKGMSGEEAGSGVAASMLEVFQNDPANPGYDSVLIDDLKIAVSGAEFDMPKLKSKVSRDKKGRAVKVVTDPFKMTLGTSEGELGEKFGAQLALLGYEKLELSGQGEQAYDPDKDMVTIAKGKNFWKLEDGFRVDFSGQYEGASAMAAAQAKATAADAPADPGSMMQDAMDKLAIHNFQLAIDDDGFLARGFNAYAAQSGEDPQQLRSQAAGMMAMAPMMAGGSGIDMELASELATALSSFITDPKTLTITLAPAKPLRLAEFSEMDDPSALTKTALGFTAKNE
ncbi:MAG: hypothetical protein KJ871_08935 [Alphaproteobacteria bacterium]|nr:hypothetical protein [Alphaproteobacteria bacterium]MBU2084782.1 hypothetical protein [Alphaproteobacteria bacterium]MBU2144140.1 hypothetical protein [Alphaproteobacteria bacterium]MBU2198255.1 hypothetical protein [Alphaproteobacteria bacterium]